MQPSKDPDASKSPAAPPPESYLGAGEPLNGGVVVGRKEPRLHRCLRLRLCAAPRPAGARLTLAA